MTDAFKGYVTKIGFLPNEHKRFADLSEIAS